MNTRPSDSDNDRVPLATVLSEQIKKRVSLNYLETPRVGAVTVSSRVARTVEQELSAALDRINKTADVRMRADIVDRTLRLEVLADEVQLLHLVTDLG